MCLRKAVTGTRSFIHSARYRRTCTTVRCSWWIVWMESHWGTMDLSNSSVPGNDGPRAGFEEWFPSKCSQRTDTGPDGECASHRSDDRYHHRGAARPCPFKSKTAWLGLATSEDACLPLWAS